MNNENLLDLKTLWEKFDDQKDNDDKINPKDQFGLNSDYQFKKKSKWFPPDFAKLPMQNYGLKKTVQFSMAYNGEERKNPSYPNVNLFLTKYCIKVKG